MIFGWWLTVISVPDIVALCEHESIFRATQERASHWV
jgi:hypothetical protein